MLTILQLHEYKGITFINPFYFYYQSNFHNWLNCYICFQRLHVMNDSSPVSVKTLEFSLLIYLSTVIHISYIKLINYYVKQLLHKPNPTRFIWIFCPCAYKFIPPWSQAVWASSSDKATEQLRRYYTCLFRWAIISVKERTCFLCTLNLMLEPFI